MKDTYRCPLADHMVSVDRLARKYIKRGGSTVAVCVQCYPIQKKINEAKASIKRLNMRIKKYEAQAIAKANRKVLGTSQLR